MSSRIAFLIKILAITLLLFGTYYLFFLRPKLELASNLLNSEKILARHHTNLLQNRLSYIELTRLDPKRANFNLEKSSLVGTLQKTNEEGLKNINEDKEIAKIDGKLTERFPALLAETKKIYEDQESLLEKVFATKSYAEGIVILKSEEAINLLTRQTNLILEYQFWLEKMEKLQGEEK